MKFDKSLLRTVLFSLGVVSFVIGVYQVVLQNDLGRNYWIFMISLSCWLPLNYWRQKEARAAKEAEVLKQITAMNKPTKKNKKGQRR
jgi:hypothetical protein